MGPADVALIGAAVGATVGAGAAVGTTGAFVADVAGVPIGAFAVGVVSPQAAPTAPKSAAPITILRVPLTGMPSVNCHAGVILRPATLCYFG
jgi:hypothetical protein